MIPVKNTEWCGQKYGKDRGMIWMVELFSLLSLKARFDFMNYHLDNFISRQDEVTMHVVQSQ